MRTLPSNPGFSPYRGLGTLGADAVAAKATSSAASYGATAGASSIAAYAGAGAAAGPIGAAVGLVVGIVVTKLLTKNYLNVAQMNAAESAEIAAFNQYRAIMGQAPGRQFGLPAMRAVWKGALHSGYFARNNATQCFHDGCSAHPGNASLVDTAIDGGSKDRNTFPDLLPAFRANRSAPANVTGGTMAHAMIALRPLPGGRAAAIAGLGRLGRLGALGAVSAGAPDAVNFIDGYFIPANAQGAACSGNPCYWAAPASNTEHQILYDVADAWLAQQPFATTPYVAARPIPLPPPAPVIPATATTGAGTVVPAVSVAPRVSPVMAPTVTPQLPSSPADVAVASVAATSAAAATSANLDASLAAQGFARIGSTSDGYPIYSQNGQTYLYQNGQLFPYGSVAQVAATGSAGTGASVPVTGLDPTTAAIITSSLQQGLTPAQAAAAALQNLQAQGVPITPDVQSQVDQAAGYAATAGPGVSSGALLLGGGALLLILLAK